MEIKIDFWKQLSQDLEDYGDGDDGALDQETFDKAAQIAEAKGLEVLTRKPNELLLDLDTEAHITRFRGMIDKLPGMLRVVELWKSKNNHHARIELWTDVEPVEALLLQACFGSDPVREALCFIRLKNGVQEPSRLFTPRRKGYPGDLPMKHNKPADSYTVYDPFKLPGGWHYWDEKDHLIGPFKSKQEALESASEPIKIL